MSGDSDAENQKNSSGDEKNRTKNKTQKSTSKKSGKRKKPSPNESESEYSDWDNNRKVRNKKAAKKHRSNKKQEREKLEEIIDLQNEKINNFQKFLKKNYKNDNFLNEKFNTIFKNDKTKLLKLIKTRPEMSQKERSKISSANYRKRIKARIEFLHNKKSAYPKKLKEFSNYLEKNYKNQPQLMIQFNHEFDIKTLPTSKQTISKKTNTNAHRPSSTNRFALFKPISDNKTENSNRPDEPLRRSARLGHRSSE